MAFFFDQRAGFPFGAAGMDDDDEYEDMGYGDEGKL